MKQNLINSNSVWCRKGNAKQSIATMGTTEVILLWQGSNATVVKIRLFKLTNLATPRARDGPQQPAWMPAVAVPETSLPSKRDR